MNIELELVTDNIYKADMTDLPGSPPIGFATTPEEAITSLFFNLLADKQSNWTNYMHFDYIKVITK